MQFNEKLNEYINILNTTAGEVAEASGLSPSVISRYKSGKRIPVKNSDQLMMLANGLADISTHLSDTPLSADNIYRELVNSIDSSSDYTGYQAGNLNTLLNALKINTVEMAKVINYDPSYISRVRSKQRTPGNAEDFIRKTSYYVADICSSDKEILTLSECIGCSTDKLENAGIRQLLIEQWLSEKNKIDIGSPIHNFLQQVNDFNLDDYMRKIHFDDIKIPQAPFTLPSSKTYYGIKAMKQGELDFLKATVLSRSKKPVYMYSDMPMEDMGKDEEFRKKYIFGLGMMIRKGLHLNVIHNINRPFNEMMMGLIGYIPLYMTGQISPYYFDRIANPIFSQLNNVSGAAALEGQCVGTHHDDGKYYFTNNKREIEYYHKRALNMIHESLPLMNIYRHENKDDFYKMWNNAVNESGTYLRISYSLPIYTIPDELFSKMLIRHNINESERKALLTGINAHRKHIKELLKNGKLQEVVFDIPDDEFESHPPCLSLNNMFFGHNLDYTKEEYREHLEATTEYSKKQCNYSFQLSGNYDFRNIEILIQRKKWVILSKNHSPVIHFVIKHPLLRDALEKLAEYYM